MRFVEVDDILERWKAIENPTQLQTVQAWLEWYSERMMDIDGGYPWDWLIYRGMVFVAGTDDNTKPTIEAYRMADIEAAWYSAVLEFQRFQVEEDPMEYDEDERTFEFCLDSFEPDEYEILEPEYNL